MSILCGAGDELWVQLFSTDLDPRGFGQMWIRISGGFQELVEVQAGFTPVLITADEMIGIQTDQLEIERIAVSTIERRG